MGHHNGISLYDLRTSGVTNVHSFTNQAPFQHVGHLCTQGFFKFCAYFNGHFPQKSALASLDMRMPKDPLSLFNFGFRIDSLESTHHQVLISFEHDPFEHSPSPVLFNPSRQSTSCFIPPQEYRPVRATALDSNIAFYSGHTLNLFSLKSNPSPYDDTSYSEALFAQPPSFTPFTEDTARQLFQPLPLDAPTITPDIKRELAHYIYYSLTKKKLTTKLDSDKRPLLHPDSVLEPDMPGVTSRAPFPFSPLSKKAQLIFSQHKDELLFRGNAMIDAIHTHQDQQSTASFSIDDFLQLFEPLTFNADLPHVFSHYADPSFISLQNDLAQYICTRLETKKVIDQNGKVLCFLPRNFKLISKKESVNAPLSEPLKQLLKNHSKFLFFKLASLVKQLRDLQIQTSTAQISQDHCRSGKGNKEAGAIATDIARGTDDFNQDIVDQIKTDISKLPQLHPTESLKQELTQYLVNRLIAKKVIDQRGRILCDLPTEFNVMSKKKSVNASLSELAKQVLKDRDYSKSLSSSLSSIIRSLFIRRRDTSTLDQEATTVCHNDHARTCDSDGEFSTSSSDVES
ncbi:MAG: hypothetical protein CL521_00745 [Actinobacteria bacterium]|nr:hypothetical protein [Actinomycetota bacterium]